MLKLRLKYSVDFHTGIDCGPPKEPRNGFVTLSGRGQTHVNNTANYSCSRGYRVQGDKQRVCQLNGLWSGNVPGCLGEFLEVPQEVECRHITVLPTQLWTAASLQVFLMLGSRQMVLGCMMWPPITAPLATNRLEGAN